jgi:hypothetical protein
LPLSRHHGSTWRSAVQYGYSPLSPEEPEVTDIQAALDAPGMTSMAPSAPLDALHTNLLDTKTIVGVEATFEAMLDKGVREGRSPCFIK